MGQEFVELSEDTIDRSYCGSSNMKYSRSSPSYYSCTENDNGSKSNKLSVIQSRNDLITTGIRYTTNQHTNESGTNHVDRQILLQVQNSVIRLYEEIYSSCQLLNLFPSLVYQSVPRVCEGDVGAADPSVTSVLRDATVNSLRFLNMFCNCSASTFSLAVSMFDRLISTVPIYPSYATFIGTCCFYMAAKAREPSENVPDVCELFKLSRCSMQDLQMTELQICSLLRDNFVPLTPLSFLDLFYNVLKLKFTLALARDQTSEGLGEDERCLKVMSWEEILGSLTEQSYQALVARLEVLICQFEFSQFRSDVLALALLSYGLQEQGILQHPHQFSYIVELQYFCQISDIEFIICRGLVIEYLAMYHKQPTKLPRLQLAWCISRRTLHKMRPSTRASQDLEPILEDDCLTGVPGDEEDFGSFDSESDDCDIRENLISRYSFQSSHQSYNQSSNQSFINPVSLDSSKTPDYSSIIRCDSYNFVAKPSVGLDVPNPTADQSATCASVPSSEAQPLIGSAVLLSDARPLIGSDVPNIAPTICATLMNTTLSQSDLVVCDTKKVGDVSDAQSVVGCDDPVNEGQDHICKDEGEGQMNALKDEGEGQIEDLSRDLSSLCVNECNSPKCNQK